MPNPIAGFPDETNTGVPAGTNLTTYTGPMTITTPGTVIDGQIINGSLRVTAANVTITNSVINYDTWWGVDGEDADGITVQNCTIVGPGGSADSNAGILGSGTFSNNNISNSENGIVLTGGASRVTGNYIHDLQDGGADPHYDGISVQGNQDGVLIQDNTIVGRDTADVFIKDDFGPINDITVNHNLLIGEPGFNVYVDGRGGNGAITNVAITDNYVQEGFYGTYSVDRSSPEISGNVEFAKGDAPDVQTPDPTPSDPGTDPDPTPSDPGTQPDPTPSDPTPPDTLIEGSVDNDRLFGSTDDNIINGLQGADTMYGMKGDDIFYVDNGGDRVVERADHGTDLIFSGISHTLEANVENLVLLGTADLAGGGNAGANTIIGNDGDNTLNGGAGDDRLFAGGGNDVLLGGAGSDELVGGAGIDTADYSSATGVVIANMLSTPDHPVTGAGAGAGDGYGDTFSGIEYLVGSSYNDKLIGDAGNNYISGGDGADQLVGYDGDDHLAGGNGIDILRGQNGADTLDGGAGGDWTWYVSSSEGVTVNLATGAASGGEAAGDSFTSIEYIYGSNFADNLTGDKGGNYLVGAGGDDILHALGGNDRLRGGAGNDHLFGGAGSDRFDFTTGDDHTTVEDFQNDVDTIELIDLAGINTVADAFDHATEMNGNTVFDFGDGDLMTILNMTTAQLADDIAVFHAM